jgi:hypothetical protein
VRGCACGGVAVVGARVWVFVSLSRAEFIVQMR